MNMLQFTSVKQWFFRVEANLQVSCGLFVLPLVVQLWNTWIVVILLNAVFISDTCACKKIGHGFRSVYVVVMLCLFCDLRAEVVICFIDICVIVGHISLFKYIYKHFLQYCFYLQTDNIYENSMLQLLWHELWHTAVDWAQLFDHVQGIFCNHVFTKAHPVSTPHHHLVLKKGRYIDRWPWYVKTC